MPGLDSRQVIVGTSPTLIADGNARRDLLIVETDTGAADVTLGDAGVVAGQGPELRPTTPVTFRDAAAAFQLYGVVASGSQAVNVLESTS
jgi:hypothetical protein